MADRVWPRAPLGSRLGHSARPLDLFNMVADCPVTAFGSAASFRPAGSIVRADSNALKKKGVVFVGFF